jgi:hypothetical protein
MSYWTRLHAWSLIASNSRLLQSPFAGQLGLYAGMRAHQRVLVLLALLGGHQRVELAQGNLEAL